ncbi:MAG: TIGR03960 family B12-binding radical SAM protein [Deltaproteobacteria bacterium]|jgi:radical SAM family uncharacterized protein/radical SAM-linked protein|nr:TIGR03960 family B12-binding radical SAM protein [Deltaproteobacteria bacterium]
MPCANDPEGTCGPDVAGNGPRNGPAAAGHADTGDIDPLDGDGRKALRDPDASDRAPAGGLPPGDGGPDGAGRPCRPACPGRPAAFDTSLLREVQRPGRYLGGEIGAEPNEIPDGRGRLFRTALAFPDVYEIAHSHLGHKILYSLVNSVPGLSAERVYATWPDMERALRARGLPLTSLESRRPLAHFDLVGFSLQYELGYTNILAMLDLGRVPLLASERAEGDPLVCAGGPGCANPEPLADFFDFFLLGDAEPGLVEVLEALSAMRAGGLPRREILRGLAARPGVYVPSLFRPLYVDGRRPPGGFAGIEPLDPALPRPRRTAAPSLSGLYFPRMQIVPFIRPVHDRVAVEISRGCSRGCRFCQAGYIYRPVRERGEAEILDLVSANLSSTGHDEAAFLSLSAGDHTGIDGAVRSFMDRFGGTGVSLSLPSLRVRSVSRELALQIQRARKTGFTVAPEAATARLRSVINKDLSEEDLLTAAGTAFSLGWRTLKLYFMCGLPTETGEDLEAIGALARRIKRTTRARLNVGLAHFTPKAHTPFQWEPGSTPAEIRSRIDLVKASSRRDGIAVKHADPGASFAESLLARGDRRAGRALLRVFRAGARFEAWNDLFDLSLWEAALAAEGFDEGFFRSPRDPEAPLPWDHLFYGVDKAFLLRERERAYAGIPTPDCRDAGCLGCGACSDGARVELTGDWPADGRHGGASPGGQAREAAPEGPASEGAAREGAQEPPAAGGEPREAVGRDRGEGHPRQAGGPGSPGGEAAPRPLSPAAVPPAPATGGAPAPPRARRRKGPPAREAPPEFRYAARFETTGRPVFLGHLELVELFKRAFRRGGLRLALSRGFHPSPRLSFLSALPLGVPSQDEVMVFSLTESLPPETVWKRLELPAGLRMLEVSRLPLAFPAPSLKGTEWLVSAAGPVFRDPPLFPEARLSYTDGKGRVRSFALGEWVLGARALSPERLALAIAFRETGGPRPLECARALWGLDPSQPLELSKLRTLTG